MPIRSQKPRKGMPAHHTVKVRRSHITQVPAPTHLSVMQPRNAKQVKNKMLERQHLYLSHDALYNLHKLATDMPDFVQAIRTHLDLVCICAHKAVLEELDRVLLLHPNYNLMIPAFNWGIFTYQHLLFGTPFLKRPLSFQLPFSYIKGS